jgi:hypothetical protein
MAGGLRIAVTAGVVLLIAYLALRQMRSNGIQFPDFLEAVGLAVTPLLLPGAVEMIVKALGGGMLPIFNDPEDRIALFLGGAAVISAVAYGGFAALHRAWTNKRA